MRKKQRNGGPPSDAASIRGRANLSPRISQQAEQTNAATQITNDGALICHRIFIKRIGWLQESQHDTS
jgi:hypothetical protein